MDTMIGKWKELCDFTLDGVGFVGIAQDVDGGTYIVLANKDSSKHVLVFTDEAGRKHIRNTIGPLKD